jgi:hypothetical protein
MSGYKEEEGRALRAQVEAALREAGGFVGNYSRVRVTFKSSYSRIDFTALAVKVAPAFGLDGRPSIFRLKLDDANPETVKALVEKAAAKFHEFEREGEAAKKRSAERERVAKEEDEQIAAFMAEHFPEFRHDYDRTFSRENEYDFSLTARIEGGAVAFQVRLDGYVSADEAREIADLLAMQRARRAQDDSAGCGDTADS